MPARTIPKNIMQFTFVCLISNGRDCYAAPSTNRGLWNYTEITLFVEIMLYEINSQFHKHLKSYTKNMKFRTYQNKEYIFQGRRVNFRREPVMFHLGSTYAR